MEKDTCTIDNRDEKGLTRLEDISSVEPEPKHLTIRRDDREYNEDRKKADKPADA